MGETLPPLPPSSLAHAAHQCVVARTRVNLELGLLTKMHGGRRGKGEGERRTLRSWNTANAIFVFLLHTHTQQRQTGRQTDRQTDRVREIEHDEFRVEYEHRNRYICNSRSPRSQVQKHFEIVFVFDEPTRR